MSVWIRQPITSMNNGTYLAWEACCNDVNISISQVLSAYVTRESLDVLMDWGFWDIPFSHSVLQDLSACWVDFKIQRWGCNASD